MFHGWIIALASGFGLACGIATVVTATFPIFVGPIAQEFGWSQADAFTAPLLITLTIVFIGPWTGALVDRHGPRRVIVAAFALEAVILASFYWQGPQTLGFYARYVLLGALALGTSHIAFARLISVWFDRRRGLALGVALTGVGIGGAILPVLCHMLIRDDPRSMGLTVDGAPAKTAAAAAAKTGKTLDAAVRTGFFWWLLLAVLLIGVGIQSVMLHMKPLLESRGMSAMSATLGQSAIFVGLVGGRLLAGWMMDRWFAPRVALIFLLAALGGVVLLATGASGALAYVAALLVGLSSGGEVDVIAYLAGRYYGLLQFSRIYSIFYSIYSLGGGLGPRITAGFVDASGDYTQTLWLDFGLLALAGLMLLRFPPFPAPAVSKAGAD